MILGESMSRMSWAQSMHDGMSMIFDAEKYPFGRFVGKKVGDVFPLGNFVRDNRMIDPNVRDVYDHFSMWNTMKNELYQYINRGDVPLHRDPVFGEPTLVQGKSPWGGPTMKMSEDIGLKTMAFYNVKIPPMPHTVRIEGIMRNVTEAEFQKANDLLMTLKTPMGTGLRETMAKTVTDPAFDRINNPIFKAELMTRLVDNFRETALKMAVTDTPEKIQQLKDQFQLKIRMTDQAYKSNMPNVLVDNLLKTYGQNNGTE
jgi:hypothetical protein